MQVLTGYFIGCGLGGVANLYCLHNIHVLIQTDYMQPACTYNR